MVLLAHEVWELSDGWEFSAPDARRDAARVSDPAARLVHVIHAASWVEAMTKYHAWQGWAPYVPMDRTDTVYTEADLARQRRLRPDFPPPA